jgi:hypothetical protein
VNHAWSQTKETPAQVWEDELDNVEYWKSFFANTITAKDLKQHLNILASDEYEGRETGMPGQKKAAQYLADYYKKLGVPASNNGSYFQQYALKKESLLNSYATLNSVNHKFIDDFYCWGANTQELDASQIVFIGYGIEDKNWNDYAKADVKGKVILCISGEPFTADGKSMITGTEATSDWAQDYGLKMETAMAKGAKAMLVVSLNYDKTMQRVRYWLENASMRLDKPKEKEEDVFPMLFIDKEFCNDILASKKKNIEKENAKILKKKKSKPLAIKSDLMFHMKVDVEKLTAENVLCYIEGTDEKLKNEVIIISAHYDHIGIIKGQINNGADDDGSGTVSTLELAQAFLEAKKNGFGTKRSILILNVSGEEKGLLGSEWYSDFPIYPLANTVCNLNIDMIGRQDDAHTSPNYVYIIGSDKLSTDLHKISEQTNDKYTRLSLDYTYNDPEDPNRFYYRSDHYNFAKHNIPVIFYFSGVHEDYHKPTDDVEKILFDKMETIAKLVFYTAWDVANRDEKLKVDVINDFENK